MLIDRRWRFTEEPIDAQAFKELVEAGLTWLKTNCQIVNSLNVFPVPDGDTGTNMVLTMQSALDEIADTHDQNIGKIAHDLAHGALMGGRGNSGVILSQLMRGFALTLDGQSSMTTELFVKGFAEARDTAYRSVVRPVEGTILTVSKDMAKAAEEGTKTTDDLVNLLEFVVAAGDESVKYTPELLPILKEAGVVDAGGLGLYYIFEGMLRYIKRQSLDTAEATVQPLSAMDLKSTMETVEPGQDYEVIVDFHPNERMNLPKFYGDLEEMGTSIQVGEGDGLYRVHIHVPTEKRYDPIEYALSIGTITKVHIENLMIQVAEIEQQTSEELTLTIVEPGQIAIVVVSPGPGISRIFASLEVSAVVPGGQTMNPSTQEIVGAFENLPTDKVIILPNNKNIILTSKAAADFTVKNMAVVPSKTIPQGMAAMFSFKADGDFDRVVENMTAAIDDVETGEITTATRAVEIDGIQVEEGQIIALHNGKLVLAASGLEEGCMGFLEHANVEAYENITLFYGADISLEDATQIADKIQAAYPGLEVEIRDGGQPHYQIIFSIE